MTVTLTRSTATASPAPTRSRLEVQEAPRRLAAEVRAALRERSLSSCGDQKATGSDDLPLQAFLARYMHPDFQQKKLGADTYGDVLRKHFRNGLAHGFAVSHGGFEGAPGGTRHSR